MNASAWVHVQWSLSALSVASVVTLGIASRFLDALAFAFTELTVVLACYWYRRSTRHLANPLVLASLYPPYGLLTPWIHIRPAGRPLASIELATVSGKNISAMFLTGVGWLAGSTIPMWWPHKGLEGHTSQLHAIPPRLLVPVGSAFHPNVAAGTVVLLALSHGIRYGENQVDDAPLSAVTQEVNFLFFVASLVLLVGNIGSNRRPSG